MSIVNRKAVDRFREKYPSYILVDFLRLGVSPVVTAGILAARGVFKWMAVRAELFALAAKWKKDSRSMQEIIRCGKKVGSRAASEVVPSQFQKGYWKGYQKALEEHRKELKDLLSSPKWRAPGKDRMAKEALEALESGTVGSSGLLQILAALPADYHEKKPAFTTPEAARDFFLGRRN